ncbi:hypothetical protein E2562_004888 [Oryza meyeriana var. granulata]|uniref:Uncharacterized protein n=1 Tax=Oryza meyeriana var. granulata TaxID=110450 RepID=A0A6G1C3X4_9ORYZ|nr:hypothetical protein E2562_004888 [Oryza meyeriana var. granulata]
MKKKEKIHSLLNEVDPRAFTNCSLALGILKPSQTVLWLFTDLETLMVVTMKDLHKLFFSTLLMMMANSDVQPVN